MTPHEAYIKCKGKISKDLERIIIKDPEWAYFYACHIIGGRWKEAENIISTDSYWAYIYAGNIIKGKLPENMHNMMLLHADKWAKLYFDYIENLPAHTDCYSKII
jgi:hypothetical protein